MEEFRFEMFYFLIVISEGCLQIVLYLDNLPLISINNLSVLDGSVAAGTAFFSILFIAFIIKKSTKAITTNLMIAAKNLPYLTAPQVSLSRSSACAAFKAGARSNGVITSSTRG